MTGQDFQDKLDSLVVDLQTSGKGQTVNLMFRGANGEPQILPLSSNAQGIVNAAQLSAVQAFINPLKAAATAFDTNSAPLSAATQAFKNAQAPHQALIDAASNSRTALSTALDTDPVYQAAKTAADAARVDADYISSRDLYAARNVGENFAELSNAKGKYVV